MKRKNFIGKIEQFERLGKSEIELVNIFMEGLAAIIKLEQKLEAGEDIETDIALVSNFCGRDDIHSWS